MKHRGARWYSLRVRPYLTTDNQVDGAVLALVDIDDLKRAGQVVAAARDYAQNTVETVREPLLVLDQDLRVESANRAFYRTFRVAAADTIGRFVYDLGNRQWDIPRLRELLEHILPQKTTIEDYEVEHHFETIGSRVMLLNARQVYDPERKVPRILLAIEDITERNRAEADLRARMDELSRFNDVATGRELRMIELKEEVNTLCERLGEPAPYPLDFEREG